MRILFVASELAPLAKTGGLGDVCAALPRTLADLGHDVRVVVPLYSRVRESQREFATVVPEIEITLGDKRVRFSIASAPLPGTTLPVHFVHCPSLYDRPSIYTNDTDEHLRFAVLQWAAIKLCQHTGFSPQIVHCNDWQTALLPLMLKTVVAWDRLFAGARSVLTIHNVGYQGAFPAAALPDTGLLDVADRLHQEQLRAGVLNCLLTGILHADAITAVSPSYALEIQTEEHGAGMDRFLRARAATVYGILNGIDDAEWSPERDRFIAQRYSLDDLDGKERNKQELMRAVDLPYDPAAPVIGIVSRLVAQKGFDLCFDVLPHLLAATRVRLVVLGRGAAKYEGFFSRLARAWPEQVAFRRGFSDPLAHAIEAGADLFLMPSRYEPCGLNQMYSLRYGTVPVVHRTGGLADTVRLWHGEGSNGNGFVFDHFDVEGLRWALRYALATWGDGRGRQREIWREIQRNGMVEDFSWKSRIGDYVRLYERLLAPARLAPAP